VFELVRTCAISFLEGWPVALAACFAAAGLLALEARAAPRFARPAQGLFAAGAVGLGLYLAWQVLWLCDDAYISFRYARNFAEGHGLVYNVGEWVEGYTNFLWTFLLGWVGRLGGDIPWAGLVGNLASFAVALVAVALTVRRAAPGPVAVPFAALALAATRPFHTFASSGLETMPVAALVALAMLGSLHPRRGPVVAGLALAAGTLMRPDQVLLFGAMGLAFAVEDLAWRRELPPLRRVDVRRLAAFAAPFALLVVPWFSWRWSAYGDLFPNTFYAKSGGGAYWTQGGVYLTHFLLTSGGWIWLPLFVVTLRFPARDRDETRLRAFAFLGAALLGLYVVRVGGDFMEHRFFVPLLPMLAVAVELALRWNLPHLAPPRRRAILGAAALALVAAAVPVRPIGPWEKRWHLADESSFYRVKSLDPLVIDSGSYVEGTELARVFTARGLAPRVAHGAIGLMGYHSRLPIVDTLGLVNRRIARKPVLRRGRPGHEKVAEIEDVLAEEADIALGDLWGNRFRRFTTIRADGMQLWLVRWDPALLAAIARMPDSRVPDLRKEVRRVAEEAARSEQVEVLAFLERFLALHPQREALLLPLRDRLRSVADFEGALPPSARVRGDGLSVRKGRAPRGATGTGWLASTAEGTGEVELPLGRLIAGELRFAFGGSASPAVFAELLVDGAPVRRVAATGADALAPQAWDLAPWAGREGLLRFVDEDPGGSLLADAVHFSHPTRDIRQRLRAGKEPAIHLVELAEEVLPADDPELLALASRFEHRWDLDTLPEGAVIEGRAFGRGPVDGALWGQQPVVGMRGAGLLNSFHGGDRSTGRVELPPFRLTGGDVVLLVGGGRDCERVYVGLEVDGAIVRRACGNDDETLRQAVLPTARFAGRQGRIVIVDESSEGWGHILVDQIVVERPAGEAMPAGLER